ncbi:MULTISPECIES: PIN domain-containing protein [Pseudomonas]|uniref:PIN domain-containing protein n=1 Tax=Pseudomonas azadiae TaxID=2843612 RepID=A0ABS6NWG5_9PSED|nr:MULTISPECIES: PIN domain-containing protein [Pseudomonas]MBV4452553.1 PIN domain-containing protein [Pseudomonas azadiae]NMF40820.1 PIN domain-containing protein [Pseudomonas sp. SWRI 103]
MRCSPFTAVYDACVLYPAALRDLLMWLGLSGLYRARWTRQIHGEWKRNVLKNRPDVTTDQVDKISALMDKAIPDALVTGYGDLCSSLDLPDPDDRHVLAAAIRSKAEVIVTFNLKDFPVHVLAAYDIEPMHPDDFISDLWDLDQAAVLAAVQKQRRALARPSMNGEGYLEMLMRQGLVQTSKLLGPYEVML